MTYAALNPLRSLAPVGPVSSPAAGGKGGTRRIMTTATSEVAASRRKATHSGQPMAMMTPTSGGPERVDTR
ncbi:hypothetical protein [Streptomyces spiralis]|uniref:hypothetical protein n=1 Tax=Streptomyces spiralis TaxID=66376 RepID=UPI00369862AD